MTTEPGVLFAPRAHAALRRGIDLLVDVVRPTLGPVPRCVAVAHTSSGRPPEVLDHAATILQRMVGIPDPYADMGAMLVRQTVWRTSEVVGDGGATTAVLLQAILRHVEPYLAAGGNVVAVRRGLERGCAAATTALNEFGTSLEGTGEIERAAEALCHDPEMAVLLAEILDIVGTDGYVELRDGYGAGLQRQYVEGTHWYEGYLSPYFVTDTVRQEARLENAAILISDLRLTAAEQLTPLLQRMAEADQRNLLVIAHEVSGSALGLLVANHQRGSLSALAVKAPFYGMHQAHILEDLAVLTGGRVVTKAGGQLAETIKVSDLGHARLAWAAAKSFGLRGGQGDRILLRKHIARVRAEQAAAVEAEGREQARERLGKLMGGVAILDVGDVTRPQQEARKATAQRTLTALRLALSGGVAPGGGSAYIRCQSALQTVSATPDEAAGVQALAAAIEEPLRVIANNAGYEPATVVAHVRSSAVRYGFDARKGQIADMRESGIVDPVPVLQAALEAAVSGAVMALTTEVLIHKRKPRMVAKP